MKLALAFSAVSAAKLSFEMDKQQVKTYHGKLGWPTIEQCQSGSYPDSRVSGKAESFTIDLDLPPNKRFTDLGTKLGKAMQANMEVLRNAWDWAPNSFVDQVEQNMGKIKEQMPKDFVGELEGLSEATGISINDLVIFNVVHQANMVTTVVSKDNDGTLRHGLNMDIGLGGGFDGSKIEWALTESMKHTVVELTFTRNKQVVFKTTSFAGYIGALSAVKPGAFSMSMNARYDVRDWWGGITDWLAGNHDGHLIAPFSREVFEKCSDYDCATKMATEEKLASPFYIVLADGASTDGAIIARERNEVVAMVSLGSEASGENGSSFLVQSNSDPDRETPFWDFWDDHRKPALKCVADNHDVFDVLSTKPVLNLMTAYTTLMNPKTGDHESFIRHCPFPCTPF